MLFHYNEWWSPWFVYLSRDADFRFFSLGHVDDVNAIDEDVFQAAQEIGCSGQMRQVLLYDTSDI